jgi:hypothetical protein
VCLALEGCYKDKEGSWLGPPPEGGPEPVSEHFWETAVNEICDVALLVSTGLTLRAGSQKWSCRLRGLGKDQP